jgi:hypothetical protein
MPGASPLEVASATTPRFLVTRFATNGTYPRVRGTKLPLNAVNKTLRLAILADQQAFEPYARRYAERVAGRRLPSRYAGYYETQLDRTLVSASSVVVSVLIPRTRAVLPLQAGADGWLGVTIRVRSGRRVTFPELFSRRAVATRLIEARIRRANSFDQGVRRHAAAALANPQFVLLPSGLAVGVRDNAWRNDVLVPYSALRPYLSELGRELVSGTRWPDYRPDRTHFSYCRRPGLSWAELSATGDVPCAAARKVEAVVFSARCAKKNRCLVLGFTCLAYWDGRYDRPFEYTNHAVCDDNRKRRVEMDEG